MESQNHEFIMGMTYGEKYSPIVDITEQSEADEYFEKCVKHTMLYGKTREEAEKQEKNNIGYWAGYFSHDVRLRVEKLFSCQHPILGKAGENPPSPEECFEAGVKFASDNIKNKNVNNI